MNHLREALTSAEVRQALYNFIKEKRNIRFHKADVEIVFTEDGATLDFTNIQELPTQKDQQPT